MANDPTFQEVTACQRALFEWADSYDTKDWERLKKCIAPTLRIDYRAFLNKLWEAMPSAEFIAMASSPHFLGNPLLKTQHFVGLSTWQRGADDDEIVGTHQLRVPHQRYKDESMKEVAVKGHAHGTATVWYRRVAVWGHEWKFAGVCPHIRWSEFDYDKIFEQGEEQSGNGEGGGGGVGEEVEKVAGKDGLRDGEREGEADVVDGKQNQADEKDHLGDGEGLEKGEAVEAKGYEDLAARPKDHVGDGEREGVIDGVNGREHLAI
ncbi:Scytalone dehydratase-domain-containing protein [Usnea florida]